MAIAKDSRREIRPLSTRLNTILLSTAVLVLIAMTTLSYLEWNQFRRTRDAGLRVRAGQDSVERLLAELVGAESGQRGFLLTGEAGYLEPYNQAVQAVPTELASLNKLLGAPGRGGPGVDMTRLGHLVDEKMAELGRTIEVRKTQDARTATEIVLSDRGRVSMEEIRDICSKIRRNLESERIQVATGIVTASRGSLAVTTAGSVFLMGLLIIGFLAINEGSRAREHALAEARRARDLLGTTLESIGDAVISTDTEARVVFANRVALSLLKAAEGEVAGRPLDEVFNIVNESTRARVESPVKKVLRDGRVTGLANHTVLIARDGSEIPIDDSGAPVRGEDGPIQGTVLVFRDITERRRAEATYRLLAAIVESSDDGVISEDLDGIITSWNEGAERMFGYTAPEVVGKPISLLIPADRPNEMPQILERIRRGERLDHYETTRRTKDGRLLDVSLSISPMRDGSGQIMGASKIARNITAHKRAERALRESEERYRASFSNAAVGIAHVDLDGRWMLFNDAVCHITGYAREELSGKSFSEITHPDDIEADWALARRLAAGEIPSYSMEKRYIRKEGRAVWVNLTVSLMRDSAGTPLHYVAVTEDITERKQAEEELRGSNEALLRSNEELRAIKEQLQLVTNNMAAAVARCSRDFRFVWVSRSFAAWMGRPLREIAGRAIADVTGAQGYEEIRPYMERVLTGQKVEFTIRVNFIGPGERWIHSVYVPTYSHGEEVDGWIAVVTDITEEKRTAEQVRAADQRVRALVANSSDGVVLLDERGTVLFAGAPILGYSNDEWMGRNGMDLLHPEDQPAVRGRFTALVSQPGNNMTLRYRAKHRNGSWRWIEATSRNLLEERAVHGVVVNYRDITEQRQTEENLREQAQLLDLTRDAIMALGWNDAIGFWNRGAEECYGWSREEAVGKIAHDLLRTEFPEPLGAIKQRLAADGHWQGELIHTRRDGSKIVVASRWALRRGADDLPGYLETNTDITERKRAEEQLRQKQRLEGLGILAGGIAHDFNNLLVGILGNASLALDILGPATPARERLEDLISASERAASLTRQLLAYAGKEQVVTRPTELSPVVRDLAGLLRTSIPRNVCLTLKLQEPLPCVNADKTQLQQVIMNVVINAAEAIPQNTPGSVTITTAVRRAGAEDREHALTPLPAADESYVVLTVTDTGQGMTPEVRSRIFDPFYTTKFTGRGLGLSAVLGIVKAHHGTITLKTAPGAGTTFTLLLPQCGAADVPVTAPATPQPGRGSGTILVVDDEPAVRAVAQNTLEDNGYRVLLAADGQEAIDVLAAHPETAAIILDLAMPVMNGDEAAPRLRGIRPAVPIILSSGYAEEEARRKFSGAGITCFLQKPYRAARLLEAISASLGTREEA
jgi:two-component system cell cycle sensor histidine kinase/response regulator CckA